MKGAGFYRVAIVALLALSRGAAFAAHPLNTDDTGTQGKDGWQLELNGEANKDQGLRGAQASMMLSYGVADTADLQFALPWQDTGTERGAGDIVAALKWRFWERGPLSGGLRGAVSAPTGDETRRLGNARPNWAALLIGQYEGKRWIVLGHLAYRRNLNSVGDRESLSEISGAVLYRATAALKLVVDANRTTNADPTSDQALREAVIGAIYSPSKDLDLDVGFRRGNDAAIDRAVMAGVTLRW